VRANGSFTLSSQTGNLRAIFPKYRAENSIPIIIDENPIIHRSVRTECVAVGAGPQIYGLRVTMWTKDKAEGEMAWLQPKMAPSTVDHLADRTEDRKYRPDVEGLRALAVLLVALYHAHIPGIRSGFVGVDVFFVISGFLITGLLVRERINIGTVSIQKFYARRARRILPAATVVVLFTLFASYHWLGFLAGDSIADDAKWTALFVANLHFAAIGSSYLTSQAPPSPLQHMWSLGVEEQFYVVWPTLFFLIATVGKRVNLRFRLGIVLSVIVIASFAWSIIETSENATWAYFSPLTRAWELALGGLVAVSSPLLMRVPRAVANSVGGIGLGGVIVSGIVFSSRTPYPGSAVALPVLSTAAVIAAGCAATSTSAERLLSLRPCQWLGKRSFSFYLWHWPILIIAYEAAGHELSAWQNALWLLIALIASMLTYRLIENPIRFSKPLIRMTWLSLTLGAVLILASLGVSQLLINTHQGV
jgi:peptidoglycan/LPS O-acetylase OafA/YrhL